MNIPDRNSSAEEIKSFIEERLKARGLTLDTLKPTPEMTFADQANRLIDEDHANDVSIGLAHLVDLGEITNIQALEISLGYGRKTGNE